VQSAAAEAGPDARPLCFALSNPTEKAEVRFGDAWEWSGGRVVYASGTAFPGLAVASDGSAVPLEAPPNPWASQATSAGGVEPGGSRGAGAGARVLRPAQCNNSHVFPGLALGCIATGASAVNDDMLLAAAGAIAGA
jgi:malate dehydrogenase (oxaloacetate-decarboxylating)(NADP+)